MSTMTITEALADLKTLAKRIQKKRDSIGPYVARQEKVRDPLEGEGGSTAWIKRERQAIGDLCQRMVDIRLAIAAANQTTDITVCGITRSIAGWLIWRREVAEIHRGVLDTLRQQVLAVRSEVSKGNLRMVQDGEPAAAEDVVICLSETELAEAREQHEQVLGDLDGQLSLKNATVMVDIED